MNKLTIVSRLLVAFASGALATVYFLPAWRIDLFAPQYPEGLVMKIWVDDITGDVDVINGLNHYIGMKHITVDMFPEFKFLPFVVGFFVLLGLIVAFTGQRKFLFAYLVLTAIGGASALYDFYRWGYDYGHNLDPKAPIQVPGLSYQPPLIGHKRLLNFDAYSFPDVGGWIVICASALAFGVWFVEWYREYKTKKTMKLNKKMAVAVLSASLLLGSCSTKPEPFKLGLDECSHCRMTIIDPKFGGETITTKGKIFKFDDVNCMLDFLSTGKLAEKEINQNVVVNYEKKDDFINVNSAYFLTSPDFKSPMGSNTAAFVSKESAKKISSNAEAFDWNVLKSKMK